MRRFIRHPAGIPIEVSPEIRADHAAHHAYNVGVGGLAFRSDRTLEPGTVVKVRIPFVRPAFETEVRVVWCRALAGGAELGVEFLNRDDAFRARMVEQLCYIENYQKAVKRIEGRVLSMEEAASEWIGKYAPQFPKPDSEPAP